MISIERYIGKERCKNHSSTKSVKAHFKIQLVKSVNLLCITCTIRKIYHDKVFKVLLTNRKIYK